MTRSIPLTKGRFAIVDADRFHELNAHRWHHVSAGAGVGYAGRTVGKRIRYLHHDVLRVSSNVHVDHANLNGLDCRFKNLRIANRSLNGANRGKFIGDFTSKYKGVVDRSAHRLSSRPWLARIRVRGHLIHIGYFGTEYEAAVAYDCAAVHHFVEFARTNFPWKDVA
jgi:hypothetical protein